MQSKKRPSLDDECTLIAQQSTGRDESGNECTETVRRKVWCADTPAAATEVARAGQKSIAAERVLVMDMTEYQGEVDVEFDGDALTIYRTYPRTDGLIELYCGKRVNNYGVPTGTVV